MLLQTNSYIVPKDKRTEHARLLQRFRQCLARLGCEHFEAYEQVGANWSGSESTGRFVQLMRFRDRKQQQQVQAAERSDPTAQALIKEFCELINFPYQQQQGLFAVGFYQGIITLSAPVRQAPVTSLPGEPGNAENPSTTSGTPATEEQPNQMSDQEVADELTNMSDAPPERSPGENSPSDVLPDDAVQAERSHH